MIALCTKKSIISSNPFQHVSMSTPPCALQPHQGTCSTLELTTPPCYLFSLLEILFTLLMVKLFILKSSLKVLPGPTPNPPNIKKFYFPASTVQKLARNGRETMIYEIVNCIKNELDTDLPVRNPLLSYKI